ncbi:MAG: glycosyl transferase group 1 [Spirochaetes bacterium]|nr:MAG: glycosyl transferase group 1 [Spirochaetota bacterium]
MTRDGYRPILIPNGVADPLGYSASGNQEAEMKIEKARRDKRPLVMAIARDAKPKRMDILREAARLLVGKATFLWIGGDPKPEDPWNFKALGRVGGASSLVGRADLFALASDHEGMPVSVLEAFAAGVPVVASAVGGIPELLGARAPLGSCSLTDRGAAVRNEAKTFADAIQVFLGDGKTHGAAAAAARKAWEGHYSADRMALRYLELYASLTRGEGR